MSSSAIRAEVEELSQINTEIKRMNDGLRKLREKKKMLEANIAAFLNQKDIPGVKYNGDVILLQRKQKIVTQGKKTRDQSIVELLRNSGVAHPEDVYKKMQTVGKETVTMETIKINKNEA